MLQLRDVVLRHLTLVEVQRVVEFPSFGRKRKLAREVEDTKRLLQHEKVEFLLSWSVLRPRIHAVQVVLVHENRASSKAIADDVRLKFLVHPG